MGPPPVRQQVLTRGRSSLDLENTDDSNLVEHQFAFVGQDVATLPPTIFERQWARWNQGKHKIREVDEAEREMYASSRSNSASRGGAGGGASQSKSKSPRRVKKDKEAEAMKAYMNAISAKAYCVTKKAHADLAKPAKGPLAEINKEEPSKEPSAVVKSTVKHPAFQAQLQTEKVQKGKMCNERIEKAKAAKLTPAVRAMQLSEDEETTEKNKDEEEKYLRAQQRRRKGMMLNVQSSSYTEADKDADRATLRDAVLELQKLQILQKQGSNKHSDLEMMARLQKEECRLKKIIERLRAKLGITPGNTPR